MATETVCLPKPLAVLFKPFARLNVQIVPWVLESLFGGLDCLFSCLIVILNVCMSVKTAYMVV